MKGGMQNLKIFDNKKKIFSYLVKYFSFFCYLIINFIGLYYYLIP